MIRTEKLVDKGNGYSIAVADGISDTTLMGIATTYRTNVSRRYRMLPARQLASLKSLDKAVCSIKYDGEGVFVYVDTTTDTIFTFNAPSGGVRQGLPCLKAVLAQLKTKGLKKALFVAELYLKGEAGKPRTQIGDVRHISFNGTAKQRDSLSLAFYDIIMLNGKDLRENQSKFEETWAKLEELFGTNTKAEFHRVEGKIIPGIELEAEFKRITKNQVEEGVVIRPIKNPDIYKVKPAITIDCIVLGYVEGDYEGQYGVTSILTGLIDPKTGSVQAFFRVGSGFNDEQRRNLLEPLSKLKVTSPLDMTDSDGRPITFVSPHFIIEIEGESLITENFYGKVNVSQNFLWDNKTKTYTFRGLKACPILSHATFVRMRDDKTWQDGGARFEQIYTGTEIEKMSKSEEAAAVSSDNKIIYREVATKAFKGATMVRKITVITSNNPLYYNFTMFYTDFSEGRKDPLKTEIRVATNAARLLALLPEYQAELKSKGWAQESVSGALPKG